MKKLTERKLKELVAKSAKPVLPELEKIQLELYGEHRHYYYRFLYLLVQYLQPPIAIEIGAHQGVGLAHLAMGMKGLAIGVDIEDRRLPFVRDLKHKFFEKKSTALYQDLNKLTAKHGSVGVVFQDSSHHYHESIEEWKTLAPFLHQNAVWVSDDITPAPV